MTTDDPILLQAAHWHARQLAHADSAREDAALEAWLALDLRHRLAYAEVAAVGYALEQVAPRAAVRAAPRRLAWGTWLAATAAPALCLLLIFVAPHAWQDWHSDAHTSVGQQRQQILPDGSELLLDTDSAVALDFSGGKRDVELLRGALAVHVAKDPVHPFRVHCAGSEITAIGTRFLVTRHAQDVELGVTEGRVAVRTVGGIAMGEVGAGEHATIDSNTGTLQAGALAANEDSWTRGILSIDHVPLRTAVATLARYVPQHVMLRADAAADTPITATLPLNDPQAAIDALALTQGLRVRRWPGLLWIEAK